MRVLLLGASGSIGHSVLADLGQQAGGEPIRGGARKPVS
jgi:uncharacterized protein YbjT (DUF2867 family)